MADTIDAFHKLEERLIRVLDVFKKLQAEKRAPQQEIEKLKAESKERGKRIDALERELLALRRDREDVRGRIENLLEQLEALTTSEARG